MLRKIAIVTTWLTVVVSGCLAWAQEPSIERSPLRIQAQRVVEQFVPQERVANPRTSDAPARTADPRTQAIQRLRDAAKARARKVDQAVDARVTALSEFGACDPFDYSANKHYLVAALGSGGLALWETDSRAPLRRLDDSDRQFTLVVISDDARWIAAVRREDGERIDLWQADTGRHVHWLRTGNGPTTALEFKNDNELHAVATGGQQVVFSVPTGAVISGTRSGRRGLTATRPAAKARIENPQPGMPAAPSTAPTFRRSAPPVPEDGNDRFLAQPAPSSPPAMAAPTIESAQPPTASPQAALPQSRIIGRTPRDATAPPTFGTAPSASPAESAPAAPMTSSPRFEPAAAAPSFAPAAPSEPEWALPPAAAAPAAMAPDEPPMDETEFSPGAAAPDDTAFEPSWAAPDEPAMAAPDEPAWSLPVEPAAAAPAEPMETESEEPSGGSAPLESIAEAPTETGAAAATVPTRQFRFEMHAEEATDAVPPATSEAQTLAEVPSPATVDIHFATNRNRLAPKDREWLVYFTGFFSSLPAFVIYGLVVLAALVLPWFGKRSWAITGAAVGCLVLCAMGAVEAYVRSQLRDEMSGELYGCRPTDISYGKCTISVPPPQNRPLGELSRPLAVWVFEARENPDEHFLLKHVEEHADKDAFYRSLSAQLDKTDARAALLFIHGYNVSFEDAIFRTAQLTVDLKFPGATMAFCWPSYADPVKYTFDEQHAEVSIPALGEVLDDLASRSGAKRIHIIAHSMGNRVLAGALRSMAPASHERNKAMFRELVLAAPDIDSRVFQSQVLPHIVNNTQHCTLYASSRDRALLMSRVFHNYQRLGETQPELIVAHGLDTIDASLVDTSLLGHSYIGDVQSIVSDLRDLVVGGKRATERLGLELLERQALRYWLIKPELQTAADPALRR